MFIIDQSGNSVCLGVPLSLRLENHQSVVRISKDELIFAGGVNYLFNSVRQTTYKFNFKTLKVEKLTGLIYQRFFAKLVFFNNRLIIIGGRAYGPDKEAILNYCEEYDFQENKWVTFPNINISRCNFAATTANNQLIISGGIGLDSKPIRELELFNFAKNRWEILGVKINDGINGHLSFCVDNQLYFFGAIQSIRHGKLIRIALGNGADLASPEVIKIKSKNVLSKSVIVDGDILVFGGYLNNKFVIDPKHFKVSTSNREIDKFKKLFKQINENCFQTFYWSKCSYVWPFDHRLGKPQSELKSDLDSNRSEDNSTIFSG